MHCSPDHRQLDATKEQNDAQNATKGKKMENLTEEQKQEAKNNWMRFQGKVIFRYRREPCKRLLQSAYCDRKRCNSRAYGTVGTTESEHPIPRHLSEVDIQLMVRMSMATPKPV